MANRNTVIIADDEKLICTLLTKLIHWEELNLKLLCAVNDGIELFNAIQQHHPDIVITDISMPRMDGIELIKQVRVKEIPCHFIIVSGYRLFEYAHNALKYNVEDYILKPIDENEINSCLKKLSDRIMQEKSGMTDANSNTTAYTNMNLLQFIGEMARDHTSIEEIQQRYGIVFRKGSFLAASIRIDHALAQDEDIETGPIIKKIISSLRSGLEPLCDVVAIENNGWSIHALLNFAEEKLDSVYGAIDEFYFSARDTLALFRGMHITIGLGNVGNEVFDLKSSFAQAETAIWSRMEKGQDRIILYGDLEKGSAFTNTEIQAAMGGLMRAMESFDDSALYSISHSLFSRICNQFYAEESRRLCFDILHLFIDSCGRIINEYSNTTFMRSQVMHNMNYCTKTSDMEQAVMQPIIQFILSYKDRLHEQKAHPVHKAIDYIEAHYNEPLSLQDIADRVQLSPTYFSNLFKEETGQNFTNYLTDVRIKNARKLLQQTNMSIADIAERVGYPDGHYFSKVFHKSTGLKPSAYRKIYG